jgi:hypothetical protein
MLLNQAARSGIVERVNHQAGVLEKATSGALGEFLAEWRNFYAGGAKEPLPENFHLPSANLRFAVKLRAHVVFLDPVPVNDAQVLHALTSEIVS